MLEKNFIYKIRKNNSECHCNTYCILRDFEKLYTRLRKKKEGFIRDEEVLHLPDIANDHPHYKEWQIRKESCKG